MNIVPTADLDALEGASCYRLSRPDVDSRVGPDLWHPVGLADRRNGKAQEAVQVCRRCPVRLACVQIALRNDEQSGIWGGFNFGDPADKQRARKFAKRKAA